MAKPVDGKKLNKEQLEAVRHKKGPLLIIAGAGTGKTTAITERIKFLIEKNLAKPSEILALTFTEKAAREMEERVDQVMPYGYTQMWISTFHSFCDRVLRAEALHIGLDPRFKLMTQAGSIQFIRKNLFKFKLKYFRPLGNPTKFIDGMLKHFSRLQDEDILPTEYLKWAKGKQRRYFSSHPEFSSGSDLKQIPKQVRNDSDWVEIEKWLELAGAYKTYEELKIKEGVFDFGDLIVKTLKLFRDRPNVLKQYRKQFEYVLVDEFQDTNIAQNELVMLLAGKNGNITVVADDDQSIYKWRGAAVSNVLQFRKNYPKAKLVTLTRNYRSTQEILDKAYDLIQHNNPDRLEVVENIDKKLKSQVGGPTSRKASSFAKAMADRSRGDAVKFLHLDRVENEADEVAREIVRLTGSGHESLDKKQKFRDQSLETVDYKDIAILVRANNHAEPFVRALQRHAIPYQFLGPGKLFKQPEIVDLISYLKVLFDFDDSVAFFKVLSIEHFDISVKDLVKIGSFSRRYNLSLFEACERIEEISISEDTKEKIKKLLELIDKHLKLASKETAGQILYYFLQDSGLIQELLNPDSLHTEEKVKNISKFFDKLKTYEGNHEDASVSAVCNWIELLSELGESPLAADTDWTEVNAVNILTIHSSKGLEFPVIFLVNLVSQRFPTMNRREQIPIPEKLVKEILPEGDFHIQEERRLFYVGMTRAMSRLYFTAANYYGEGKREKKLSPFIFEALGNDVVGSEKIEVGSEQLSFLDYKSTENGRQKTEDRDLKTEGRRQKSRFHVDFLSYSQIQTFQICPLHYKLRYILKVPTLPTAVLSFGITIHEVMKDFYNLVKTGKKPTSRLLYKLLKDNWVKEGYSSKSYEGKMFERGKKYLKGYLQSEFDPNNLPVSVEQPFVVPLGKRQVTSVQRPLKIGGKFDRVDKLSGNNIEIVDYKTGQKVPSQRDVDRDLQLTFYALAATKIQENPFGGEPKNIKLSLYYFEEQIKISTTRTKEQLEEAEKEIFEWREKIENSDFKCSGHIFCKSCEYSLMCQIDD